MTNNTNTAFASFISNTSTAFSSNFSKNIVFDANNITFKGNISFNSVNEKEENVDPIDVEKLSADIRLCKTLLYDVSSAKLNFSLNKIDKSSKNISDMMKSTDIETELNEYENKLIVRYKELHDIRDFVVSQLKKAKAMENSMTVKDNDIMAPQNMRKMLGL